MVRVYIVERTDVSDRVDIVSRIYWEDNILLTTSDGKEYILTIFGMFSKYSVTDPIDDQTEKSCRICFEKLEFLVLMTQTNPRRSSSEF